MYTSDLIYKQAKEAEQKSEWRKAAQLWQSINRISDAEACMLLAESIERGDAYREDVKNTIGEEPELTPTTIRQWKQWHEDLNTIYNKHFK